MEEAGQSVTIKCQGCAKRFRLLGRSTPPGLGEAVHCPYCDKFYFVSWILMEGNEPVSIQYREIMDPRVW